MKNILLILVLLLPLCAMAQFPHNTNKMRQGYQTSALGLTYYSDTIPLHTPSNPIWDTETVIDTTNDVSYQWTGYSWRATGVVRQVLAPPATKTAGGNTLDYRYADWWRDADSVVFTFNWDNTCWMPLQPYRGDTVPANEAAVGSTIGATCFTQQLWYDTDADSLKAYTTGEWIAIGSGGGGASSGTLADSMAVVRDSIDALRADIGGGGGGSSAIVYAATIPTGSLTSISTYGFAPVYSNSSGTILAASTTDATTLHQYYVKGTSGAAQIISGQQSITASFSYVVGTTYYLNDSGTLSTSADNDGDALDFDSACVYVIADLGSSNYLINLKEPRHFINN